MDYISLFIYTVFAHLYVQWENNKLPATHSDNKIFFRFWLPVKTENGEKEIQMYYLYKEGDSYLLTTSKRKFDIVITKESIPQLKEWEQKVLHDFISKVFNVD